MRLIHLFFILAAFTSPARAATINLQPMGLGAPDLIVVEGELFFEDAGRFQQIAARTENAVVALAGPGGNAVAAVIIGDTIRSKGFASVVLDGDDCASGCALAWLGGVRRFRGQKTRIGFHAARQSGSGRVSAVGNTIVRSYLHRIGFSAQAAKHLTAAAPQTMAWLTRNDARTHGIDVDYLAPARSPFSPPAKGKAKDAPRALTPLEEQAVAFVRNHVAAEAQALPGTTTTAPVSRYANAVFYYGKYLSREGVAEDYAKRTAKASERQYSIRAESIEPRCFPDIGLCDVTAILDWVMVGPASGKTSAGQASLNLGLLRQDGSLVITSVTRAPARKTARRDR